MNWDFFFIFYIPVLLTLTLKRKLRVFENRVPKRDEITGECIKLHNEELNDLYCSPNIVRVIDKKRIMRGAGRVARVGDRKDAYRILVWRPEGKSPLGRPNCR
jgi:hypothetical protein